MTRLEAALELIRLVDVELTNRAAGRPTPAYISRHHHAVTSTYIALSDTTKGHTR